MIDIVSIPHTCHIGNEPGNCRNVYISKKLHKEKISFEIIAPSFDHTIKKQRSLSGSYNFDTYSIHVIRSLSYKKNISIVRIFSNYFYSKSVVRYLKSRKKPDMVFCTVPTIAVSKRVASYCNKNKVKLVLDVRDLWPESFRMIINVPFFSNVLFYKMMKDVNYVYSSTDGIIAVSETFLQRALQYNKKNVLTACVFLGSDMNYFDSICRKPLTNPRISNDITIVYIGTLSKSYDIALIIDAIKILYDNGNRNIEFCVMGDGPDRSKSEKYAKEKGVKCNFTGRLSYDEMVKLLIRGDIAVNPIIETSVSSIINKVGDYAMAGLPVINTQPNHEYRTLLDTYNAGINCTPNDKLSVALAVQHLIDHPNERFLMGKNNRRLAEDKFNRNKSYEKIVNLFKAVLSV